MKSRLPLGTCAVFMRFSKNVTALWNNHREHHATKIHLNHVLWQPRVFFSNVNKKDEVPGPMSSRYEIFSEETSPIVLDVEEERLKVKEINEHDLVEEFQGINLERGVTGVFEIKDIVDILYKEKAQDIFVTKIPPEYNYADYMIVVTGRSERHMHSLCEYIRKIYKKKMDKTDCLPKMEGKRSNTWMALDLGNIILHVFSKKGRRFYDLESLWSVGKEYDSHFQKKEILTENIMTDYSNLLASLTPDNSAKN